MSSAVWCGRLSATSWPSNSPPCAPPSKRSRGAPPSGLVDLAAAAPVLGRSVATLRRLAATGKLPGLRNAHDPRTTPFLERQEDIASIFRRLPQPRAITFAVGVLAGLRPGEVLALQFGDIDWMPADHGPPTGEGRQGRAAEERQAAVRADR